MALRHSSELYICEKCSVAAASERVGKRGMGRILEFDCSWGMIWGEECIGLMIPRFTHDFMAAY